jgi:hypothetical protein
MTPLLQGDAGTGCWILDTGCWILVAGYWILVAGYWILVAGCWMHGAQRIFLPCALSLAPRRSRMLRYSLHCGLIDPATGPLDLTLLAQPENDISNIFVFKTRLCLQRRHIHAGAVCFYYLQNLV